MRGFRLTPDAQPDLLDIRRFTMGQAFIDQPVQAVFLVSVDGAAKSARAYTSLVEPLPHQITAVYESMLPRQPLRFLLADDPGAGKTIMAGLLIGDPLGPAKRGLGCRPAAHHRDDAGRDPQGRTGRARRPRHGRHGRNGRHDVIADYPFISYKARNSLSYALF